MGFPLSALHGSPILEPQAGHSEFIGFHIALVYSNSEKVVVSAQHESERRHKVFKTGIQLQSHCLQKGYAIHIILYLSGLVMGQASQRNPAGDDQVLMHR